MLSLNQRVVVEIFSQPNLQEQNVSDFGLILDSIHLDILLIAPLILVLENVPHICLKREFMGMIY